MIKPEQKIVPDPILQKKDKEVSPFEILKKRFDELKKENPLLDSASAKAIVQWEDNQGLLDSERTKKPLYGVKKNAQGKQETYLILFHGSKKNEIKFPQEEQLPEDFDAISHIQAPTGHSSVFSLTIDPDSALRYFGDKLGIFLIPVLELNHLKKYELQDIYSLAVKTGSLDNSLKKRAMAEAEFISVSIRPEWYKGFIQGGKENVAGIVRLNAESYGMERSGEGIKISNPNVFLQFVENNALMPNKQTANSDDELILVQIENR